MTFRRTPVILLATTAAGALVAGVVSAPGAGAAAPRPAISLVRATPTITITHFEGEPLFGFDLGINAVAGDSPFRVDARRASYRDPVVARQVISGPAGTTTTKTLPAGLVTDLSGLGRFLHLTVKDAAGTAVVDRDLTFCPSGFSSTRARPDAPATSPYPQGCSGHPFTVGGVWGLQSGWASNTADSLFSFSFLSQPEPIDLPDGTYTASMAITKPYRDFFALPAASSRASVKVTVTTVPFPAGAARAAAAGGTAAGLAARPAAGPRLVPAATAPTPSATVPAGPKPDLVPQPPFFVQVVDGAEFGGTPGQFLAFAATVSDLGPSPLLVDGFRRPGTNVMDAFQYFFDAQGNQVGSKKVGTFTFDADPAEQEWHFTDFATYRLLDSTKTLAVRSTKQGFCLAPTDPIDLTIAGAKWQPSSVGLGTACTGAGGIAIRESLPAGWGDTYLQFQPGQSFDLTGIPNGTYYIEVVANPNHRLVETSTRNNRVLRKVILGGTPTARTVTVPPYQGIDAP